VRSRLAVGATPISWRLRDQLRIKPPYLTAGR